MPTVLTDDRPRTTVGERPRLAMLGGDIGTRAAWAVALSTSVDTTTIGQAETEIPALVGFRPDVVIIDTAALPPDTAALAEILTLHSGWSLLFLGAPSPHYTLAEVCRGKPESVVLAPFDINTVAGRALSLLERRHRLSVARRRFSPYVVNIMNHFARRYRAAPSVDALAGIAGVSRSHLTHGFRAETGLAVMEYLVAMRVQIAKELLRGTDVKLEHLAKLIGFCDASHFSRVFRVCLGLRPGHYRRGFRDPRFSGERRDVDVVLDQARELPVRLRMTTSPIER